MRIAILITTYKRAEMLLPLLQQIDCQRANHELAVICVHDGPSSSYEEVEKYLQGNFSKNYLYSTQDHFGKSHYYRVINVLYEIAKTEHEKKKFDYLIQIPDDISLADNFFEKAIRQFENIQDPQKICLNLLNDGRNQPGWTRQPHKEVKFGHTPYILTQWVDMCFLSTSRFFESLNWKILRIDQFWASNPNLSSGVGLQISQRLFGEGNNIYQVKKTLVSHGDHDSVMHPEHRKLNPLICKAETSKEKVIAGMASMVGREGSLREAVASLLPQVDEIHVTLNGYFEIPGFLKGNKKIHSSIDATNKYGDAAKFKILGKSGYLFFTDDDLIYPADYVNRLVDYIEKHKRAAIITVHGRRFESFPVKSYYHGKCFSVRCLALQPTDEFMHCPGTGVTAFHSSTIPVQLKDFEAANMADIWLGIAAQKYQVPVMAIRHNKGWIRESFEYDVKKSIHYNLHSRDAFQTKIVNSVKWTLHTLALNG